MKLVNIRNDDIADGNPKLTLGLIWTIILHFQVVWGPAGRPRGVWPRSQGPWHPGTFLTAPSPAPDSARALSLPRGPRAPGSLWGLPVLCPLARAGQGRRASLQRNVFSVQRAASCPGRVLEKHPPHWLTHPLPAPAAQEATNLRAEQAEPGGTAVESHRLAG